MPPLLETRPAGRRQSFFLAGVDVERVPRYLFGVFEANPSYFEAFAPRIRDRQFLRLFIVADYQAQVCAVQFFGQFRLFFQELAIGVEIAFALAFVGVFKHSFYVGVGREECPADWNALVDNRRD